MNHVILFVLVVMITILGTFPIHTCVYLSPEECMLHVKIHVNNLITLCAEKVPCLAQEMYWLHVITSTEFLLIHYGVH